MSLNSLSPETNELEDLETYRPFSALSVVAFFLGALGLLALKFFALWFVALLGFLLGARCILSMSNQRFGLISRSLATLAVILGVFSLSFLFVDTFLMRDRLYRTGGVVGLKFLQMLQNKQIDEAYRLNFDQIPFFEFPGHSEISKLQEMTKTHRMGFMTAAGISSVLQRGKDANWKMIRLNNYELNMDTIVVIDYIDASMPASKVYSIEMARQDPIPDLPNEFFWCVNSIEVSK